MKDERAGFMGSPRLLSQSSKVHITSRPLDVHRWSDYPHLRHCLSELVAELTHAEQRQRKRARRAANQFSDAVRCIILDLYVAWCADPNSAIGVSLGKESFASRTRYDALFLTYDTFRPALAGLISLGYVDEVRKGFHDPRTGIGRTTRIRATPKLITVLTNNGQLALAKIGFRAGEGIVLRDEEKNEIDYNDNKATMRMRSDLERINSALASHWIDLYLPDDEMEVLNARMAADYLREDREAPCVDLSARRLRRVFNNRAWDQGGRFYGGWWQTIPKEYRPFITINGKHTVEIDYSGMHPAMMYAEVGAALEGDAYEIGAPGVPRDVVKRAFNKLVNAAGRTMPTPGFYKANYGLSWAMLLELVIARHEPIAQFLGTGYGVYLQCRDAQIANQIMMRFLDMRYLCLPVHDSFIVHHALEDDLTEIMRDEFLKQTGAHIKTSPKFDVTRSKIRGEGAVDMSDPTEVSNGSGKCAGHEARLMEWFSMQT